jgi:hypothetical protein
VRLAARLLRGDVSGGAVAGAGLSPEPWFVVSPGRKPGTVAMGLSACLNLHPLDLSHSRFRVTAKKARHAACLPVPLDLGGYILASPAHLPENGTFEFGLRSTVQQPFTVVLAIESPRSLEDLVADVSGREFAPPPTSILRPAPIPANTPSAPANLPPSIRPGSVLANAEKAVQESEDGLEVLDSTLSLVCPLTSDRLRVPARGEGCRHLRCFDLEAFLRNALHSGLWFCTVCDCAVTFAALRVCGWTRRLLREHPQARSLHLNSDLTVAPSSAATPKASANAVSPIIIADSDDDDDVDAAKGPLSAKHDPVAAATAMDAPINVPNPRTAASPSPSPTALDGRSPAPNPNTAAASSAPSPSPSPSPTTIDGRPCTNASPSLIANDPTTPLPPTAASPPTTAASGQPESRAPPTTTIASGAPESRYLAAITPSNPTTSPCVAASPIAMPAGASLNPVIASINSTIDAARPTTRPPVGACASDSGAESRPAALDLAAGNKRHRETHAVLTEPGDSTLSKRHKPLGATYPFQLAPQLAVSYPPSHGLTPPISAPAAVVPNLDTIAAAATVAAADAAAIVVTAVSPQPRSNPVADRWISAPIAAPASLLPAPRSDQANGIICGTGSGSSGSSGGNGSSGSVGFGDPSSESGCSNDFIRDLVSHWKRGRPSIEQPAVENQSAAHAPSAVIPTPPSIIVGIPESPPLIINAWMQPQQQLLYTGPFYNGPIIPASGWLPWPDPYYTPANQPNQSRTRIPPTFANYATCDLGCSATTRIPPS